MAYSVETEVVSAARDKEAEKVTAVVEWRLIDEASGEIAGSKTVTLTLEAGARDVDLDDLLRTNHNEALDWGAFRLATDRLGNMVGRKMRTVITSADPAEQIQRLVP